MGNGIVHVGNRGPKVLVVEDEAETREFLAMAFKCEGYGVELAEDGEEAVEIVSNRPGEFSAVFLDLLTPGKDGLEALREIRTIAKDLPVFVTSFTAAPGSVVEAMRCGATDFIVKPVTHEDLREHMLQVAAPAPMTAVSAEPGKAPRKSFGATAGRCGRSSRPYGASANRTRPF